MRLVLFICIVFTLGISAIAHADVNCKRKTNDTSGFVDTKSHDWWFPKQIFFEVHKANETDNRRIRFSEGYLFEAGNRYKLPKGIAWELLPNGQLFGIFLDQKSGFMQIRPRKYVCSMTVSEVLHSKNKSDSVTKAPSSEKQPNSSENKMAKAKRTCSELGFEPKTEKHGSCVLRLLDEM